ncbi:hypothetical protein AOLI_G00176960 [Acnodon oligacanthus]
MGRLSLALSPRRQQIKERRHVVMKVIAGLERNSRAALGNGGGSVRTHESEKLCGAASCCAESFVDIMPPSLRVGRLFTRSLTCSFTEHITSAQLEGAREVSPLVVVPASSFRIPGNAVLTPAPHGPWERRCRRPSLSPQLIFTSCNRFAALSSLAYAFTYVSGLVISSSVVLHLKVSEVLKENYQTLLDTARRKTDARIIIPDLYQLTGGDPSCSGGSSCCNPGSAAGAPLMAWTSWTTGPRFGNS